MRSSLDLSGHQNYQKIGNKKNVQEKMIMLESLYEDIINNIREAQSIKNFGNTYISNDPEWLKIKCVNEEQRIRLK